jgi:cytochrome c oxidase cbb3-type subunit I/II
MSNAEKKLETHLDKIEKKLDKEVKRLGKTTQIRNLFPIVAAGLAVFLLMVSMVVVAPYMFLLDVPASNTAHSYTTQEAEGRNLFMSLGCFYCHSQQVRPSDWGIGNVSQEGDYVYDSPHALGTERTGPDLAQIGGMRPTVWHQMHDRDPRSVSPGSIMPNFGFLSDSQIDALVAYIQNLGKEDLQVQQSITNGSAYHPIVPEAYINATNQFIPIYFAALEAYDFDNDVFNGNTSLGDQWAAIYDAAKIDFTQRCLSCHGCSGNAQGPYARHVVTQPANLNERIATFPGDNYHIWRVTEGVPGTAMPAWGLSLNATEIRMIAAYEMSFVFGSARTIDGAISDDEGDVFAQTVLNTPPISGTQQDYKSGQDTFNLYCAQCHGVNGQGDGPASSKVPSGYINPVPANFTESGSDFLYYGRYVWKVKEGVETTNMPPWKLALTDNEIYRVVFYVQAFSTADDYNTKWAPQYSDPYAQNLKANETQSGFTSLATNPVAALIILSAIILWNQTTRNLSAALEKIKLQTIASFRSLGWRTI